jgi:hypothetical protein
MLERRLYDMICSQAARAEVQPLIEITPPFCNRIIQE